MNSFTGTGSLVRLILRRDRVILPIWILVDALLPMSLASGTAALYKTDAERQGYIDSLAKSPLLEMFYGRPPGPSLGALIYWRGATAMTIMGLIGLLFVIRHTRVEEEAGRRELIGSTVVGRHASLMAAMTALTGAAVVTGVLVALGMMSQKTPAAGSFAMGFAWAAAAILFGAVGAVAAQLSQSAGPARGISILVLAASFGLRAWGDLSNPDSARAALSWVSPLGWIYKIRAYQENNWWIFGLVAVLVALLMWAAIAFESRRDVGAGMIADRLGPQSAAPTLKSPLALAWRLHRGTLLGWSFGFLIFGALVGGVTKTAADLIEGNTQMSEILERMGGKSAFTDVYIAGVMGLMAMVAAGYAIAAALKLRTEESSLRSEPVLATGVSRIQWAGSHLVFALLGPAVVLLISGAATGLTYGASISDIGRELPRSLAGAAVQLPAVWVFSALTFAVFGLLPRLSAGIGWAALSVCVLLGQVGAILQLDQILLDVSPFTHIPKVPGGDVAVTPLVILTAVVAALIAVGIAGFRRRDIPVT